MSRRPLLAALAAAATLTLSAGGAEASAFCMIRPTADGFVALRDAPSPSASLLARMTADDEVMLTETRRGAWVQVRHWRGQSRLTDGGFERGRTGWVNSRLLTDCG